MSHVICGIVVPSRIEEFNGKYHEDLENALLICTGKLGKNEMTRVICSITVPSRFGDFHRKYSEKMR